jgi:hypothetical protein
MMQNSFPVREWHVDDVERIYRKFRSINSEVVQVVAVAYIRLKIVPERSSQIFTNILRPLVVRVIIPMFWKMLILLTNRLSV